MKYHCDIIRDLLPLYADDACSEESRKTVEEHLQECPDCTGMLNRLKDGRIEENLRSERTDVIEYGARKFKKRSATVGSAVSGLFMIPILVCLIINIATGAGMGWFFIVLASLAVAASLVLVPILVPEDKLFWTFCGFTVSLMALLGVTCLVSRGHWFWVASSAVLFGLSVIFLPFVIKAKPLKKWIGNSRKWLIVLVTDAVLFLHMMLAIALSQNIQKNITILAIGCIAAVALVALEKNREESKKE